MKDGRNLVMDWGDAVVSHPFFTLSVTLEGGVAWGLDDVEDSEDLEPYVEATWPATHRTGRSCATRCPPRSGWAGSAGRSTARRQGPEHTRTRLRMFLDGKPE